MKEPMRKYRIFLVCGAIWSAFFFVFNVLRIWAELWSGDGVQSSSIAGAIAHMAALCYVLLIHDRVMLFQAARDARKKWDIASLPAKASLEVALQRIDRQTVTDGDIETLNRTTCAMSAALANYVAMSKRLSST